ncbi:hypothetical protein N8654_04770 [Synechococcus sp. AH-601-B19]|nr:hypothetical protein [Synechococcus sp. AH-601-B19]
MTNLIFNQSFFAEHFDKFEDKFNNEDAHSENFYTSFYDEFCSDDDFTAEDKQAWMDEWKDYDYDDFEGSSFTEFIDEHPELTEDLASWLIGNNESIKAKAIPQLFLYISEMWSAESIQDAIDEIKEGK